MLPETSGFSMLDLAAAPWYRTCRNSVFLGTMLSQQIYVQRCSVLRANFGYYSETVVANLAAVRGREF